MENCPEFKEAVLEVGGVFDTAVIEKAIVSVAKKFVSENAGIGAIVLECSSFPPYAAAIQEVTDLPVFDCITLINMVYNAVRQRRYVGFV